MSVCRIFSFCPSGSTFHPFHHVLYPRRLASRVGFLAVVLNVWSWNQHHASIDGDLVADSWAPFTPDQFNQKIWGWGPGIFNSPQVILMYVNIWEPLIYEFPCSSASCRFLPVRSVGKRWMEGGRKESKARYLFTVSHPVEWFMYIRLYVFMSFPIWDFFKLKYSWLQYYVSVRCTAKWLFYIYIYTFIYIYT